MLLRNTKPKPATYLLIILCDFFYSSPGSFNSKKFDFVFVVSLPFPLKLFILSTTRRYIHRLKVNYLDGSGNGR